MNQKQYHAIILEEVREYGRDYLAAIQRTISDPSGTGSCMDGGVPKECVDCHRLHIPDTECHPYSSITHGIDAIRRFWKTSLREDYM